MKNIINFLFPQRVRIPFLLLLCVLALFALTAFRPTQDAPPVDPLAVIGDQLATALIVALSAAVAWLINQVRALKAQGVEVGLKITPDNWEWLIEGEVEILVKAARQIFPPAQTNEMLAYAQSSIFRTLEANKIPITPAITDKVRAIIEAAVFDLYAEFPEAKPSAKPPTETTNSK